MHYLQNGIQPVNASYNIAQHSHMFSGLQRVLAGWHAAKYGRNRYMLIFSSSEHFCAPNYRTNVIVTAISPVRSLDFDSLGEFGRFGAHAYKACASTCHSFPSFAHQPTARRNATHSPRVTTLHTNQISLWEIVLYTRIEQKQCIVAAIVYIR